MNNPDDIIEAYFNGRLSDVEKKEFEERCVHDKVFAEEVALYVTSREAVRQLLLEQKMKLWDDEEEQLEIKKIVPAKRTSAPKWFLYAAAAFFILAVASYYYYRSTSPHLLAKQYVKEHYKQISQTMNASADSLQQGIAAYNNKDYAAALQWFEAISPSHPQYYTAKKYTGLVYLVNSEYDKALKQFDYLVSQPDLYRNPGLFLKAVTLLERNGQEDKEQAKKILEQVVQQKAEGSKEAQKWLEKW